MQISVTSHPGESPAARESRATNLFFGEGHLPNVRHSKENNIYQHILSLACRILQTMLLRYHISTRYGRILTLVIPQFDANSLSALDQKVLCSCVFFTDARMLSFIDV